MCFAGLHFNMLYSTLHVISIPWCIASATSRPPGKPLRLLFVGDSIAVGVGAKVAAPLQAACAARLADLQRRPVEYRTVAANGADVRQLQQLLDVKEDAKESFDIAVVLCGVNDGKKFWQGAMGHGLWGCL